MRVRDARDDDAAGLIELIRTCWSAYPGCVLDVDGELPHLRAIASAYRSWRGRAWIAEHAGRVTASIGLVPVSCEGGRGWEAGEIRMLYVLPGARRAGLGSRLLALAEAEAASRGARRIELWSDTRFTDAHRFYLRHGYVQGPDTRELHDRSNSVEYSFLRDLPGG
jgi:GNAT superfamily N-acetyltransferase